MLCISQSQQNYGDTILNCSPPRRMSLFSLAKKISAHRDLQEAALPN